MRTSRTDQDPRIGEFLDDVVQSSLTYIDQGNVCDQIPALRTVSRHNFGISVLFVDGREALAGDAERPFSIQSIGKLFSLAIALESVGEAIWDRVSREQSGTRYDSIAQLERDNGIPRNPFLNSGAIVVVDALMSRLSNFELTFRDTLRRLSSNPAVDYDQEVYESEAESGDLNRAIAFYLRSKGNLIGDPTRVLDAYFKCCSMSMSCRDLTRAAQRLIGPRGSLGSVTSRLTSIMRTCGLYDFSGEFAYRVGLPAKSGIGGGIIAVSPEKFSVCVWSPAIDRNGNSVAGLHALEQIAASGIFI